MTKFQKALEEESKALSSLLYTIALSVVAILNVLHPLSYPFLDGLGIVVCVVANSYFICILIRWIDKRIDLMKSTHNINDFGPLP